MLALVLSLTACKGESPASSSSEAASAMPADQVASPASGDSGKCPLRAADLDKLTPYRWKFAQYQADRGFIPSGGSTGHLSGLRQRCAGSERNACDSDRRPLGRVEADL